MGSNTLSQESCEAAFRDFNYTFGTEYCRPVSDDVLCWPPIPAGTNVTKLCPQGKATDATRFAYRICTTNATWDYNNITNKRDKGYTYYDDCFLPRLRDLINTCKAMDFDACMEITQNTRKIEMVGLSVSLVSLVISLFVFYHYRGLRNNRTKIHKNLFIATVLQVIIRLVIYIDQTLDEKFIEKTPYLCEICYVLLEYAKTTMFMWMFIEGLYLHNSLTTTVFQAHSYVKIYLWIGWSAPFVMTAIWALTMTFATVNTGCWYLYYFLPYYWILEGPRFTVILVNLLFLLNIIRVLVVKLRQSRTSEIEQIRKAVRAAIFLLPLMGIAHILFLMDFRLLKKAWKFALWSYTTYFLNTFQGFFIAVLYCFLNGEVKLAVKNSLAVYMSLRSNNYNNRRNSTMVSCVTTVEHAQ